MPSQRVYLSDTRDLPLLAFLWQWKLATTAALAQRFFPNSSLKACYQRLWTLERNRFIRVHTDRYRKHFAWTLEQKGYHAISHSLPALREAGYKSEAIGHDLTVAAVHLGEWLQSIPEGVQIFSEQQLRRYDFDYYPAWLPSDPTHRPDGYWNIPCGCNSLKKTIALEVELSRQRHSRYEQIGDFYARHKGIIRILWVVVSEVHARTINQLVSQASPGGDGYHDFVLVQDFLDKGWQAQIKLGPDRGESMTKLLENKAGTRPESVLTKCYLDTRKSPHRSGSYTPFNPSAFRI